MKKKVLIAIAAVVLLASVMLIPLGGTTIKEDIKNTKVETINMNAYSSQNPSTPLRLLFIHHSCGGQLMADAGKESGDHCIYQSHENGGGLRSKLEQSSYEVHEASYESDIGDKTDIFDWPPKFKSKMEKILTCDNQDTFYKDGRKNQIVAFKSCFPNNNFAAEGVSPGNSAGPELTVWNAKAAYMTLLDEFKKHPEVLFVAVTAPPVANYIEPEPLWKSLARKVLGKEIVPSGPLARTFNNWLKDKNGWLKDYAEKNVVVFDYYDILTKNGKSDYSAYPTGDGTDSHASKEGNTAAADAFVPFLNRAVRRAGLSE